MLDFNNEPEQKSDNYGPVPGGSKVMVSLSVETPQYAVADHPLVSETKKGLRGLWCKFTVIGGMYEGVKWYDTLWLPTGYQTARLDEGQIKACNRCGAQIRAIIEAHRGISPKDNDDRSVRGRRINDWADLSGMEFPAKLGISNEPYKKDGKEYWKNYITSVLTPDKEEYRLIKAGQETINPDGPVKGDPTKAKRRTPPEAETYGQPYPGEDRGPAFPSESAEPYDMPF